MNVRLPTDIRGKGIARSGGVVNVELSANAFLLEKCTAGGLDFTDFIPGTVVVALERFR